MILAILNLLLFAQVAGTPAPQPAPTPSITQPDTERVVYEVSRLRNFDDERLPAALHHEEEPAAEDAAQVGHMRHAIAPHQGTKDVEPRPDGHQGPCLDRHRQREGIELGVRDELP